MDDYKIMENSKSSYRVGNYNNNNQLYFVQGTYYNEILQKKLPTLLQTGLHNDNYFFLHELRQSPLWTLEHKRDVYYKKSTKAQKNICTNFFACWENNFWVWAQECHTGITPPTNFDCPLKLVFSTFKIILGKKK